MVSGSTVYAGGKFTTIGVGAPTRERIAAVCATNNCEGTVEAGHATAWAPNASAEVSTIAVSGSTVYIGGAFTTIGVGAPTRERVAAVCATDKCEGDSRSRSRHSMGTERSAEVGAIAVSGSTVYIGGNSRKPAGRPAKTSQRSSPR